MPCSQRAVGSSLYREDASGDTPPGYETREECLSHMPPLQRASELSHCHGAELVDSLPDGGSNQTLIAIPPPPPSHIAEHSNENDDDDDSVDSQRALSTLDILLDLPHRVYCKLCRKTHNIAKDPYLFWKLRLVRLGEGKCPLDWQAVDLGHGIQLTFWFVYLIMRAQRLSHAHGVPLNDAAFTVSGPGLRQRRVAPLVGKGDRAGHLLLRIRSTFMFSCKDVANLAASGELQTCQHQRGSKCFSRMCKDAAKLALQTMGSEKVLVQLRKCSACSSEYELTMVNKARNPCQMEMRRNPIFYTVLEHFIDIGECRDNTSTEWVGLRYERPSNVQVKLKKISEKWSVKQQFEGQKTVKGKRQKIGERVDRIRYLHKMASPIQEPFL